MRRSSPAFSLAVLLLAACGKPAQAPEPATNDPAAAAPLPGEPTVTPGPSLASPLHWEASSSGEGNAIVLFENTTEVLRIACLREGRMVIYGGRFKPVGSEERMTVGAGDVVVTLAATPAIDRTPPAVKGEGAIDADFVSAVGEGRKIAVNYGYQNMGPFDGPPKERARNFQAGCEGGGG